MAPTSTSTSSPPPPLPSIQSKLTNLRLPAIVIATVAAAVLSLLLAGPSFKSVVSFFWPLLLSTAVFLAAVVVLRLISPPHADPDGGKAGSELIDYVSGTPLEEGEEVRARSPEESSEEEGRKG